MRQGRRLLVVAAAALAVAVGGGAAVAASGAADDGFLADVAKRLGVSEDKLQDAIRDATIARIDARVAAGDLTKEQGERLKERVRSGESFGLLPGLRGHGHKPFPGPFGFGLVGHGADLVAAAADYLGVTEEELRASLRDGDSLADVAKAKGKSLDGLKQALREALAEDLDQAVEDGVLTRERADDLADELGRLVDRFVEDGVRLPGLGHGPLFGPGPFGGAGVFDAAADYLGLGEDQLHDALREGTSLAELAKDRGKSVDGLKAALRDALSKQLDEAVSDGMLTKEQAARAKEGLAEQVGRLVERSGGFHLRLHGPGFEFRFQHDLERAPRAEGSFFFDGSVVPAPEPALLPEGEPI